MVLTHGNVIFDILEPATFQKYSICWVFRAIFRFNFLLMQLATQPRPALTAVNNNNGNIKNDNNNDDNVEAPSNIQSKVIKTFHQRYIQ